MILLWCCLLWVSIFLRIFSNFLPFSFIFLKAICLIFDIYSLNYFYFLFDFRIYVSKKCCDCDFQFFFLKLWNSEALFSFPIFLTVLFYKYMVFLCWLQLRKIIIYRCWRILYLMFSSLSLFIILRNELNFFYIFFRYFFWILFMFLILWFSGQNTKFLIYVFVNKTFRLYFI